MEKIIFSIINTFTKKYKLYKYKDETWVVTSDLNDWVICLSDTGYLWYNYSFFRYIFILLSENPQDNSKYIKLWVKNILNKKVSKHVYPDYLPYEYDWSADFSLDDVLKNGEYKP